jgi:hypothetical protein
MAVDGHAKLQAGQRYHTRHILSRLKLVRLRLAELLLERYPDEKKEALEHLDFAIKEFQGMKMQPSLERALRHKEIQNA